MSFTSPTRSYVTADPGYEAGMKATKSSGARIAKTPLTKSYAHDVKAMIAAAPDAGLFYVCTPNNPTGTMTSHSDIEQLLAAKPKGSVVLVDEAYIHFSDGVSALDLVKADQDVIVLRTFSKIYGMAGIRCGMAIGRPDLVSKLESYSGWGAMPITAMAAATASLKHEHLVSERKQLNAAIRQKTFDWLDRQGYSYVPSQSNCFMLDAKRPAKEMIDAMAAKNVYIGRVMARLAHACPHHRRHAARDGSIPGRLPSRHEGSDHHGLCDSAQDAPPQLSRRPVLAERLASSVLQHRCAKLCVLGVRF